VAAALACDGERGARGSVALAPCGLEHPTAAARVEARCGTVEVPEDWGDPAGRKLRLRVAVLRAERPRPEPDAVLMLAGGPGQAATEQYPVVAPAFERLRRDRDVVLVDQRGTGGSARLGCPPVDDPLEPDRGDADAVRLVAACARAQPVDVTRYGTEAFVADLEAVRAALGYERLDLVGFSYGTRAALRYAARFPERTRALVLDGVVAPERPVGATAAADARRAVSAVLARCAADPACGARFPGADDALRALERRLAAAPARVSTRDPVRATRREVTLDAARLGRVTGLLAYAPETAALLPLLLAGAAAGDLAPLAAQGLLAAEELEAGISRPVHLSVLCAEDVPFYPPAGTGEPADETRRALEAACRVWPRARLAAPAPVRSEVPALLLSGEHDPVTPPANGEAAARRLPRARHLVLPGGGHGALLRGCVPRLVARFVAAGSADGLDASCLERTRPAPFFLDALGPAP
jgi:pimeloyl-ACP methyl ester carboxylesterase